MIYLRFGTLQNDEKRWLRSKEVFERTGVRSSAQANIITRWRRRGFRVESHVGRRGKELLLNQQQRNFLRNPQILRQWSHLSLRERAALVREKFNLPSFGPTTLRDYYLREKVRYRKPQFSYGSKERNLR